ncbi:MAG: small subunit ribosomal protein [Archaeoglobi archaeon]|nr:small subunit ribosomal protein [Archaeoglobi archaeon]
MGDPRRNRKTYETPRNPWEATRLAEEVELIKEYGLRNKRELWKTQSILRKYRRIARDLQGIISTRGLTEEVQREVDAVLSRLKKLGVLEEDSTLNDILSLTVEDFLERRLQTLVYRKGLASTIKQARQFIVHGHIAIGGRRVTVPSYLVTRDEEELIDYYPGSPLASAEHPQRIIRVTPEGDLNE